MNKTKILTSLSALAAVFAFNGNALAGTYNPSCLGNEYSIEVAYSSSGIIDWEASDDQECETRGASSGNEVCYPVALPSCPVEGFMFMYTYGDATPYNAPAANCSPTQSYTGWKLQGVSVKVNGQAVTFEDVEILASAAIEDEDFLHNGVPVDTGSTFKLVPANVSNKTVSVDIECTYTDVQDGLPNNIVPTGTTHQGGDAGETISFANNCIASGYTINQWQYRLKGDLKWSIINGNSFTIPGFVDGNLKEYEFRPLTYVPNTYSMVLKKGLAGAENHLTLKYTNPVEDAAGTWKNGDTSVTSGVNLPTLTNYTLRGMVKSSSAITAITEDASRLEGNLILRSSATANTSGTLPNLGVVTTNGSFYPAWARNCDPEESTGGLETASCTLELNHTTGSVTYTNACKPGFNTLQ